MASNPKIITRGKLSPSDHDAILDALLRIAERIREEEVSVKTIPRRNQKMKPPQARKAASSKIRSNTNGFYHT